MSEQLTWGTLGKRIVFLIETNRALDSIVCVTVDGQPISASDIVLDQGPDGIRLAIRSKPAPLNINRPQLGRGRPRRRELSPR